MADITKCTGEGCKRKHFCYRFTAEEGLWQSYFVDVPATKNIKGDCPAFWKNDR